MKPEHFVYLEASCGNCFYRTNIEKYCSTCGETTKTGETCAKHNFEIPRFDAFKCKCDDHVKDRE